MPVCGGIGEVKPADAEANVIAEKVKEEIEGKCGRQFEEFNAVSYKTQLVNGINYFIKVHVGGGDHIHVRAHKAFQGEISLHSYQESKSLEDELKYFQ